MSLPDALSKEYQKTFDASCKNGTLAPLLPLWTACPTESHLDILKAEHCRGFRMACAAGNPEVLNWLWDQAALVMDPFSMIEANEYDAVSSAADKGLNAILSWLWEKIPADRRLAVLQANGYEVFRCACAAGNTLTLDWLWEQYQSLGGSPLEMLQANRYEAFCAACVNDRVSTASWLWAHCPETERLKMLQANRYEAFRSACIKGHESLIRWLWECCPVEKQPAMLEAKNYACIQKALTEGNTEAFHFLWALPSIQSRGITWWGDLLSTLDIARMNAVHGSSAVIAQLLAEPHILKVLLQKNSLRNYIGYFSAEKQAYFKVIDSSQVSKKRMDAALLEAGMNIQSDDIESAMRAELARKAMQIREKVFSDTEALFLSGGDSKEARISFVEQEIRAVLLRTIVARAEPEICAYITRYQRALIAGDQASVQGLTRLLLASPDANQAIPYIAWRALDSLAETFEWPNLTARPKAEDVGKLCFSTQETHGEGELRVQEACDLVREQVARYFLVCKDQETTLDAFLYYMSDIRRAHNEEGAVGTDSPSCYPGVLTRLSQTVRAHPAYRLFFEVSGHFKIIEEAFYAKLSAVFMAQCRAFGTQEEQYAHYDALAALRPSECVKILSDSYPSSLGEQDLLAWIAHRKQLSAGLLAGTDSPQDFVEQLLAELVSLGRMADCLPIDRSWATYLLETLVDSDSTLSQLFQQFQVLFRGAEAAPEEEAGEEDDGAQVQALLLQFEHEQASATPEAEGIAPAVRATLDRGEPILEKISRFLLQSFGILEALLSSAAAKLC